MPAKDIIHEIVKEALERERWNVTDDPLIVFLEEDNIVIDLDTERYYRGWHGQLLIGKRRAQI